MNEFRQQGSSGFTLMEVIVVLVVIAILSVTAASRLISNDNAAMAEAELIKTHLRFAQAKAMSDTNSWGLSFSPGSYTLLKSGAAAGMSLPNENSDTHVLPSGITTGSGTVTFDSWGSAGAGDVQLVLNGSVTITITANTGFIP